VTQHPDEAFDAAFVDEPEDEPEDDQPTQLLMQEMTVEWEEEGGISSCETASQSTPLLIPGSGISMGNAFMKRRPRPRSMRMAILTVTVCVVIVGLLTAVPLGIAGDFSYTGFQLLSGSLIPHQPAGYRWYVAGPGDDLETVAAKFDVQIGGIIELNGLPVGQELQAGRSYKIPDDPHYGLNYRPANPYPVTGNGSTTFGYDWWNSYAGAPLPEQPCAPNGGFNPLGYHLHSPNWGSQWVRGFSWYHNGVDIAAPDGNPIRAAQYGVVIWAGWTNLGFGWSVVISHCYYLSTLYGHMQALKVRAGQYVSPGQIIGLEGMTGWATGPHLHFSVLVNNQFVDPMNYFTSIATLTQQP
jgi:murein DD-endopeptidase MepM/ murein hydrolase activator NlpD